MITKRDYIRIDPDWVEKLEAKGYPDGAIAAFGKLMGACEGQNPRGFFKNATVLRGHLGRHARWLKHLINHGDVVELSDGRLYMEGWTEWQEGDWKVRDRVSRIRNRQKSSPNGTPPTVTSVTPATATQATVPNVTDVTASTVSPPSDRECSEYEVPPLPPQRGGVRAEKKPTGPPMCPEAVALVQGYQGLGYVQPSAAELITAGEFVVELNCMTVTDILARMASHLAWCKANNHPQPATLGGFWKSLRGENDYRRDNGARAAPRPAPVSEPTAVATGRAGGMTRIGDIQLPRAAAG